MKEIKLQKLEESLESNAISKEEYEKQKKEIEEMPEEKVEEKEEEKLGDVKLKSDKTLIIGVIVIILLFIAFFGWMYLMPKEQPQTIEELHQLNLDGKLKEDQGYLYKGVYSFVKFDDVWYWQLLSSTGKTEFNLNFRYSPRELEDITIKGQLDVDKFNDATEYYVTFNPLGNDLTHVRLARLDYDMMMARVFQKIPVSACDRNATICSDIPLITCKNTDDIVVYYKESDELSVEYRDNCIIINGSGLDLVKGVDRILYNLYDIMEQ